MIVRMRILEQRLNIACGFAKNYNWAGAFGELAIVDLLAWGLSSDTAKDTNVAYLLLVICC